MENGWYPKQKLGNRNVPRNVDIIGSLVKMSGEIIETYYATGGNFFRVNDWIHQKPIKIKADEIRQIGIRARKNKG